MPVSRCIIRLFLSPRTSSGKIVGFGEVLHINKRELGELISISATNEEIGWTTKRDKTKEVEWDYEITFNNFYNTLNLPNDYLGYEKLFEESKYPKQIPSGLITPKDSFKKYLIDTIKNIMDVINNVRQY